QFGAHKAADRVDEQQGILVLADDTGDLPDGVCYAGARLVVDNAHGIVLCTVERRCDHLRGDGAAPVHADDVDLLAVRETDIHPALAERAVDAVQHTAVVAHAVADCTFPKAAARRPDDVDAVLG